MNSRINSITRIQTIFFLMETIGFTARTGGGDIPVKISKEKIVKGLLKFAPSPLALHGPVKNDEENWFGFAFSARDIRCYEVETIGFIVSYFFSFFPEWNEMEKKWRSRKWNPTPKLFITSSKLDKFFFNRKKTRSGQCKATKKIRRPVIFF